MSLQPPRSPISPTPPEVEIPSVEDRLHGYMGARYFEQYGNIFYPDVDASTSIPPLAPPGEGVFGAYPTFFHGAAGSSHEPHRPSKAEQEAAHLSDALFVFPPSGYQ